MRRNHFCFKRSALLLLALAATVSQQGCEAGAHKPEEHHEYRVTTPLRRDTDVATDYVCQIHASQHIELRALEGGYLQEIFVDEGQHVEKGQRMFQIMPTVYDAELRRAKAEAEFAGIEYDNTKLLADKNVVSNKELALAKARRAKAEAEVAVSKVHRNFTDIRAPFDGIMDRLEVRLGSLLEEGELLTSLSDNRKMWVYFNVSEAEYLDYQMNKSSGKDAKLKLVMANGKLFDQDGVIETIEGEFNNETGTIAFRAGFPNPNGLLRHGETGKVRMITHLKNALLVPQKATYEVLDKKYVYVVGKDNIVKARQIQISEELPHIYVVEKGLADGDRILLEGLRRVHDGQEIVAHFEEPAEAFSKLDVPAE